MSTTTSKGLEGSEDSIPKSAEPCAMRLTVRNWLSHERSFQLDPYSNLEPSGSDFDYQIDWVMDLVEFSFSLPHDYPDTREGLLRKTLQLIQGTNILGMRTTYTGESEVTTVKQDLKRKIHPRNLKKCQNRKSNRFGCDLNWIRRAGLCYLQFEVDSKDQLIVTVDENDAEYQGAGLDPVKFSKIMVLPIRIWLRFQYWTTLYRKKNRVSMPNLTTALDHKAKTAISMARTSGDLLAGIIASRFHKAHPDITSHRRKTKGKGRVKLESQEEHGDVPSIKTERGALSQKPNSLSVVHTPRSKNAQKKARQKKRRQTQKREEIAATYSKQDEKLETPLMASGPAIDISPPPSLSSTESVLNSPVVGTPFTISTSGTFDPPTTCPPSTLWVSLSNDSSMDLQAQRSFCEGLVDLEILSDEKQMVQMAGIHGKERMTDYVRDCESQQRLLCGASANTTKGGKFSMQNLSSRIDKTSAFVGAVQSSARPMASFTPPLPSTSHTQPNTQIPLRSRMSSSSSTLTEMENDSSTDLFCTEWTGSTSPNLAANSQGFPGLVASALAYIPRSIPANRQMAQDSMRYQALAKPTDGSFFIDLMYHPLTCRKSGCQKICNLYDGSTVICPCCGPYSKTRYCCKDDLFLDLQSHWGSEKLTFDHYCVPDSIPRNVRESIPLLINIHGWDTPQRHRQAVCFNTSYQSADYCVFDYSSPGATDQENFYAQQKMSVVPLYRLRFDDPEERDRFRRCLAISLFAPVTNSRLVEYFFRLVRDKMKRLNLWNCYNAALVQDQIFRETGLDFPPNIVGPKHACQTEWNGRNPNHCHNAVCSSESLQYLMGDQRTRVFHRLECERLESLHWILRINRTTHPTVSKAQDRMRGVGFGDVLPEHQRLFRRGEQFEGAGSGPIELEGVNC